MSKIQCSRHEGADEQDMSTVPGKAHYGLPYIANDRVYSFAHQIETVVRVGPRSLVEIGPGAGVVTAGLRAVGLQVTTVDVQSELGPDVVARLPDLPFESGSFDAVLCCQVLEHLPFKQFVPSLSELKRVSTKGVILSLPDRRKYYSVRFRASGVGKREWSFSRGRPPTEARVKRAFDEAGHYWEIGYRDVPLSAILNAFREAGLSLARRWRVFEKPYHHFFQLEHQTET